jgi:hypothetical protein
MEAIGSLETSVANYHCTLRKIPQDSRSNFHRDVTTPSEGAGFYISEELATLHPAIRLVDLI